MHKLFIASIFIFHTFLLAAQAGKSTFDFLLIPDGVRSSALGGNNVSVIENDLSLIYQNPSFLGQEMDKIVSVNYMSYIGDIGFGNISFAKAIGETSAWGIGVNYTNYSKLLETDETGTILGDMKANDMCVNAFFSRDLTEKIRGGAAAKILYSDYAGNTSYGLGVDLGLSYYDPDKGFSAGLVAKNFGRQLKSYAEEKYSLPWDVQLGISKKLERAPIRFSFTMVQLSQWNNYNSKNEKDSFFTSLVNHFVFGIDFIPTENFWIAAGYNVKRAKDMSLDEGNKLGGFSLGAGLSVKAFSFGCSIGKYHPSATSLMFNVSAFLGDLKL